MKYRIVIILVPLAILSIALAIGSDLMLRLFSLMVLVLLLGYLWALLGIRDISIRVRRSDESWHVGGRFGEEITVFSNSRIPKLLVTLEENTDLPGQNNVAVFNLSSNNSYCWLTEVYCQRRGQYSWGVFRATVTDPFGFFSFHRNMGEPQNILVYPAMLDLPHFQLLSRNELGNIPSRWLASEVGPNAARVREYTSDDTLNRIHWPSTAHTGKLMVKEFDADSANHASKYIWIVLDMHQASQVGDGDESTEEYGVTLAASLIKKYVESGHQVGLIVSGDRTYLFPPETGSQHLWEMMEALALMRATGEVPVERLISREIDRFNINSVVIVITPAASKRMVAPLRRAKSRGVPVIVISLDFGSFAGTTSRARASSSLVSSGFQVYVVRHGEELNGALDSRTLISQAR
ncbi:DUF58 domain-containing protein [Chloroflexota bacterium]